MKNLGLGIQELSEFTRNNLIYVDKTEIIHKLITTGKYYFLSRPRRFGKSLLVNTLKEIFSGNKKLFQDKWIYDKWDFEVKFPIIKISFAGMDYENLGIDQALNRELDTIARKNDIIFKSNNTYVEKFKTIIKTLGSEKPVAILIDEYDKPIIDYLEEKTIKKAEENRKILKNFYSVIKDCDKYIKLLFITGVSKFSKVSFFSELNNLTDITISEKFSQLTGYTENEIITNYSDYIKIIQNKFNIDRKRLLELLSLWYNGYSWDGKNLVYNPYSILNLFEYMTFSNYWFKSGTPTFLTKIIRENDIDIEKFEKTFFVKDSIFDSYELTNIDLTVLLFQTGYLTIKEKITNPDDFSISYKLAYPNKEVQDSFYDFLIAEFTGVAKTQLFEIAKKLQTELEENNVDKFILYLQSLYSDIPSSIFIKENEGYYHTVIFLILKLLKADIIEVEKSTNQGRVDAVVFTDKYIFIMEFKMSSANMALKQIKEKKYFEPYLSDGRKIFNIGVAFDKKIRNIKDYKIKTVDDLLSIST